MSLPYENATSGVKARDEIRQILQRFGCDSVGFMDEFKAGVLILAFETRGRKIQLRASAKGWAAAYLRANPWTSRRRCKREEWEARAWRQGMIAVNSILRDWVKGQVTAIETEILTFDHVFLPYMLTDAGVPVIEHEQIRAMLPAPATDG